LEPNEGKLIIRDLYDDSYDNPGAQQPEQSGLQVEQPIQYPE
jgi:hypothetical protein